MVWTSAPTVQTALFRLSDSTWARDVSMRINYFFALWDQQYPVVHFATYAEARNLVYPCLAYPALSLSEVTRVLFAF